MKLRLLPLAVLIPASLVFAQAPKPQPPEVEIPFPADIPIPPATVLSPEETLKTIKVPPGFKVELVASEPLISTPVAMQWDEDGRLWVVEMNGYMPNVDGKGEGTPNGRVVVLEDTDGDGRMDKSTVFLDQLVMPRAIMQQRRRISASRRRSIGADANHDLEGRWQGAGDSGITPPAAIRARRTACSRWTTDLQCEVNEALPLRRRRHDQTETTLFRGHGASARRLGPAALQHQQRPAPRRPAAERVSNAQLKLQNVEGVNVQVARSQKRSGRDTGRQSRLPKGSSSTANLRVHRGVRRWSIAAICCRRNSAATRSCAAACMVKAQRSTPSATAT